VLPWLETQEDAVLSAFDPNDYIYQSWAYESHDVGATPGMSRDYAKALRAINAEVAKFLDVVTRGGERLR
jgi:homoserine O-acetyltransferase